MKGTPMVATRQERIHKQWLRQDDGKYVRPPAQVPRPPSTRYNTTAHQFDISTRTDGETVAVPSDVTPVPRIEFRFPPFTTLADAHELAVRFISRRGPSYMPSCNRLVITLDGRGRQRVAEAY